MTQQVLLHDPDELVSAVGIWLGGLSVDERVALYGAVVGLQSTDPDGVLPVSALHSAASVLTALRESPCRWCGLPLSEHAIDLAPQGTDVRCHRDDRLQPAAHWLAGPAQVTPAYRLAALLGWVGLPLLSIGLLAWVMPLVAGIARGRSRWAAAAGVLFAITAAGMAIPSDLGGMLLLTAWWGGAAYGAVQIGPWVRSKPLESRANRRFAGANG